MGWSGASATTRPLLLVLFVVVVPHLSEDRAPRLCVKVGGHERMVAANGAMRPDEYGQGATTYRQSCRLRVMRAFCMRVLGVAACMHIQASKEDKLPSLLRIGLEGLVHLQCRAKSPPLLSASKTRHSSQDVLVIHVVYSPPVQQA